MKKTWFWATLVFWGILSSAVISRALIFSPLQFDPQTIQHFETQVNGLPQDHRVWVNSGTLNRLIPLIETQYKNQGWNLVGSGMDFAPTALGIQDPSIAFPDTFQIKIFEKNAVTRTLGLWQSPGTDQTYGWTCDTSQAIQDFVQARKNWNFPFAPPPNATSFFVEKIRNCQIAIILVPATPHPLEEFDEICRAQSFEKNPYTGDTSNPTFILKKNRLRLLAQLIAGKTQTSLSFVDLNK